MLSTAYHGSAAPTGPWRGTIAILGEQMIWIYLEMLAAAAARYLGSIVVANAARYGEDRRVTRKTRSAIHWGALPIYLPLTGYQQASVRGSAANTVLLYDKSLYTN
jgi:hypothetical protein